jgi:antitoxin VapB
MHLNIKDPEAHRLAQAIARETGESMTRVVTEALRSRYAEIERRTRRASLDDLRAISLQAGALVTGKPVSHGDFLYDEHGLPR